MKEAINTVPAQIIGLHRPTVAHVNLAAIRHNVEAELKRTKPGTEMFAVVKANGYGHGLIEAGQACLEAGATGLCVAILDEALTLRAAGITVPILVLGITQPQWAGLAAEQEISLTVGDLDWLATALPLLEDAQAAPLKIHLGLDTGMGRIGFQEPAALKTAVDFLRNHEDAFIFEGIFTHFATADEQDTTYFNTQCQRWQAFMAVLPEKPRYVHVSNTATSLWHDACNGNMIRFGVGIYGLNPSGGSITSPYPLEPALSLTTQFAFVKHLAAGKSVSYGATYTAKEDEWVGTLPIGYADGYPRRMQGFHVLVDGQYCEIIGRVCMDQLMVRLPHEYPVDTRVTLIGQDGEQTITMQDVADYAGTIHYEIATTLGMRVPRVYENR
ncbi:alanine racemase [Furfurilactobacillus rossiae]|uniref:Alanine racemase n=1 Tax=Furfurilactobacillus rossiae DSM 15814 TaxID=1114972 RepID=A0A0R1RNV8_9LACO|nr:alanine racemase [Furfurilactobacillus rossiae]KRL54984.1 alanine racemase [Furfurilactobacillus rossiae DSM 15814]MCF6165717.1 alanine racemase [Furfurilactobacillus rossiae]QFR67794.1 alanine racemase [Furfurilactobacillus rossiae]QLE60769.1 Alanine racemase [Furfurilactobacillus rossiae]QLE63533.1 Alanine racemase [Furfurilactobacillus rossiae]